jgi:hypothetical protein
LVKRGSGRKEENPCGKRKKERRKKLQRGLSFATHMNWDLAR